MEYGGPADRSDATDFHVQDNFDIYVKVKHNPEEAYESLIKCGGVLGAADDGKCIDISNQDTDLRRMTCSVNGFCKEEETNCVLPEEEHVIHSDGNGYFAEKSMCHFGLPNSCACAAECQNEDDHLSFQWLEGESPNCCCYVNV